jgi:hypothetical protein
MPRLAHLDRPSRSDAVSESGFADPVDSASVHAADHSDLGAMLSRFAFDGRAAAEVAWLRLAAGSLAGASGLWLAWVASHWAHGLFAAAAAVAAVAWTREYRKARAQAQQRTAWQLVVRERGLERRHGADVLRVRWTDVEEIDVDEERLVLRLWPAEGPPLALEPLYRCGGLDGLHARVRAAWLSHAAGRRMA